MPSELTAALRRYQEGAAAAPQQQQQAGGGPALMSLDFFYPAASASSSSASAARGGGGPDLGPLPPHVCSLALLPGGSGGYVPADVRWLMEEGSPVYDLYRECPVRRAAAGGRLGGARARAAARAV
jgi:hypothetical protein